MEAPNDRERGLDMTPMIDVTFLLLIFFMVATKFKLDEGRLQSWLPRTHGPSSLPAPELQELRVILRETGEGCTMAVNRKAYGILEPGWRDALEADLRAARRASSQLELPVIIDAGAEVAVHRVVTVLDACIATGLEKVIYARRDQLD